MVNYGICLKKVEIRVVLVFDFGDSSSDFIGSCVFSLATLDRSRTSF